MEIILYTSSQQELEKPTITLKTLPEQPLFEPEPVPQASLPTFAVFEQPQVIVSPLSDLSTETIVIPGQKANTSIFVNLGYGLVLGAILLLIYAFSPILIQELNYRLSKESTKIEVADPYKPMFEIADTQKQQLIVEEAKKWGVETDFSIVIPKISAAAKIIPNVNPADENSYNEALKNGVGHASGSAFPGNKGSIYLFSHSTNSLLNVARYNAIFYLVKELEKDDEIIIFYTGRKFTYKVTEKVITAADDVKWLNNPSSEEQLILQTCWPPGTSTKRLIVIAKPN